MMRPGAFQQAFPMAASDTPTPELTIAILCLDEEESIAHCVGEARGFLERNSISGEVLVVDNNSQDRSAARAEAAGARVVLETRRGYGNAIIAGIEAARGQFIILGDGDGEHDLNALEPFWAGLQQGHDFVFGNRLRGGGGVDPARSPSSAATSALRCSRASVSCSSARP